MKIQKQTCISLIVIIYISLLVPKDVTAGVDDISVIDVVEENVLVRGRTAYYTYSLRITNSDVPLTDVRALVSSQSRLIRVTEGSLQFGDVDTSAQVQSADAFTVRVSANSIPNLSDLSYTFSGQEVVIDDDVVPPTITAQLSHQANPSGWHNAPVTVTFACSDNVAIASCTNEVVVDSDGAGQIITGTAVDTSGNIANVEVSVNLDTQAPNVHASLLANTDTPPSDNNTLLQNVAIYTQSETDSQIALYRVNNQQNTLIRAYASDNNGEGITANIELDIGANDFTAEAVDVADNHGETSVSIQRLQCHAEPGSRRFYIDSPLSMNANLSTLSPDETDFLGDYQQFKGDATGYISVVPGFINDDLMLDWIMIDGDSTSVMVLINDGSGKFSGGIRKTTGFATPVAAVLGNYVDSEALDLVVAHQDGVVAIYAGKGDGSFTSQVSEMFTYSEPVVDITSGDFNQDGFADLLVLTSTQMALLTRNNAQSSTPVIANGNFANGLSAWMANATGHTVSSTPGAVVRSSNGAQLFENGSFLVSLYQAFTPSQNSTSLSFTLSSVFLEMPEGAIPDVLEVSLLNASNQSLVATFHPSATSFLNIAADGTINAASGVNYNNGQVSLDISGVSEEAILYFDLVGHPPQQDSTFVVSNVDAGESTEVDNSYSALTISQDLAAANGVVYCDAVSSSSPILVSDPGAEQIVIFQQNSSGEFAVASILDQGGL